MQNLWWALDKGSLRTLLWYRTFVVWKQDQIGLKVTCCRPLMAYWFIWVTWELKHFPLHCCTHITSKVICQVFVKGWHYLSKHFDSTHTEVLQCLKYFSQMGTFQLKHQNNWSKIAEPIFLNHLSLKKRSLLSLKGKYVIYFIF